MYRQSKEDFMQRLLLSFMQEERPAAANILISFTENTLLIMM